MKQLGAAHELRAFVAKLRRRGEGTRRRPSGGWGDSPRSVQSAQSTASPRLRGTASSCLTVPLSRRTHHSPVYRLASQLKMGQLEETRSM